MKSAKNETLGEQFHRVEDYCDKFGRYKEREAIEQARAVVERVGMDKIELAMLLNLNLETAEEGHSLIPTLRDKFSLEELQGILEELTQLRKGS